MNFEELKIKGSFKIKLQKHEDKRGYFARHFCLSEFEKHGIIFHIVQSNIGFTKKKYTIRGLHYQLVPYAESKLVQCTKGSVLDVFIDLRKDSPTFKKWCSVKLQENDLNLVFVPEGCAHGYQALENNSEVFYMVSSAYVPESERGIRWDDTSFDIDWREKDKVSLSEKDKKWPDFES